MTRNTCVAPYRRSLLVPVALVAAGFIATLFPVGKTLANTQQLPVPVGPAQSSHPDQAAVWSIVPDGYQTRVVLEDPGPEGAIRSALVALPLGSKRVDLALDGPGEALLLGDIMMLRGVPTVRVSVEGSAAGPVTLRVSHDTSWDNPAAMAGPRLKSASLHGILGLPENQAAKSATPGGGSYLIVYPPAYANTIAPLVDWKTRKGFTVETISTGVTGASTAGILAYIQEAYDTWDYPPEYILLMGDVGDIPTYNFLGNPSDHPYTLLDGDDWLPDAMIGRLPVENGTMAETVINKIVNYERNPYVAEGTDWFTRSIMVGGVEGSDTPPHTVRFCGEQLEKIGFAPAQTFLHPPLPPNAFIASMFNPAMDSGSSLVAYRGWAYGTSGWSDPRYEVNDMGGMNNGGMLPVVMSFVCLNGDYTASSPCFGEAFLRLGLPDEPRGAIAFIGNGEHWSHTRYNDAMAISYFERIITEEVADLGSLMTAGKLRFMDYFPHEMDAATYGEESVEFYFHIYNLLGDPELNFWKSTPLGLDVDLAGNLVAGSHSLAVSVADSDSGSPLAGATVAATREGVLLGVAWTDDSGQALVSFPPLELEDGEIEITVSGAGLIPFEAEVGLVSAAAHVVLDELAFDDGSLGGSGNGDGIVNPAETIAITPTMINTGTGNTGAFTLTIDRVSGPAVVPAGSLAFSDLGSGATGTAGSLDLAINNDARDQDQITVVWDAERSGEAHDQSAYTFTVVAPDLTPVSLAPAIVGTVTPGGTFDLSLTLQAAGSIGTAGGDVVLTLVNPDGAELTGNSATFNSCESGQTVSTASGLTLTTDGELATGTNLSFTAVITTNEGYVHNTTCGLVVGPVDVSTVCGPDNYGYYAYDSADLDYPANWPQYQWNEISTAMGGSGTKLDFPVDNEIVNVQVDLPFTFSYYGQDYTRIRVSDNGWIAFDLAPNFNFYNWTIPSEHFNNALIAPYWENLVPIGDGGANGITPDGIYYEHDATAGTFTVEWSRLHHYKPEILGLQTFQVVLLDPAIHPSTGGDGEFLFYYREVTNNDHLRQYASVGMESADGLDGLQLSYASINDPGLAPLQPGLAIKVTTEAPVRVPYALSSLSAVESAGGTRLDWQPEDDRPVLGWHVDRLDNQGSVRLTETPLPGAVRSFVAPSYPSSNQGETTFRLTALHPYGTSSKAGEVKAGPATAVGFALHGARPNPAFGTTGIAFSLPEDAPARLRVFDAAGRLVRTLVDGRVSAGEGFQMWDGRDNHGAASAGGIYFFRLESRGQSLTKKFILVR